jgi:hypothetical protein
MRENKRRVSLKHKKVFFKDLTRKLLDWDMIIYDDNMMIIYDDNKSSSSLSLSKLSQENFPQN